MSMNVLKEHTVLKVISLVCDTVTSIKKLKEIVIFYTGQALNIHYLSLTIFQTKDLERPINFAILVCV